MIDLPRETHTQAVASLDRYLRERLELSIGHLGADGLLRYFLEEVGPCVYNRGVADAQARLLARVEELDGEVYEEELSYWPRQSAKAKGRR